MVMMMMPAFPSPEKLPMQMLMAMAMLVFRINFARFLSHRIWPFGETWACSAVQTVRFGMFG